MIVKNHWNVFALALYGLKNDGSDFSLFFLFLSTTIMFKPYHQLHIKVFFNGVDKTILVAKLL